MAKPPKLANIERIEDFSHWLADTIQQQVSRENAGFVQIIRGIDTLHVDSGKAQFKIKLQGAE